MGLYTGCSLLHYLGYWLVDRRNQWLGWHAMMGQDSTFRCFPGMGSFGFA